MVITSFRVGRPTKEQRALADVLVEVAEGLQLWLEDNNKNATFDTYNSFRVTVERDGFYVLTSTPYAEFAFQGREAGTPPPIDAIRGWVEVKNVTPPELTDEQFAWAVRGKIANDGTSDPKLTERQLDRLVEFAFERNAANISRATLEEATEAVRLEFTKNDFNIT
jgi:hypothetical protein